MKFMRLLFLFLIGTAFTFPPADTKLEYKFKAGDVYEMQQETTQAIKQNIPGMGEVVIDTKISGAMSFKILETTSSGAKTEFSYLKVKMGMKSAQGEVVLDSEGDQTNPMNKVMKVLTTKPLTVYLSKSGTIEKIENVENISAGIGELGLDEGTLAVAKQSLNQYLNENSLKSSIEQALVQYPVSGKAGIGATWKTSMNGPGVMPTRFDNTWTLSKVEGDVASVTCDATIVSVDKDKEITLSGYKAKSDLSGQQAVKSKVNVKTGWPTEIKTLAEYKGNITLLAGGQIPEDMLIPMEISMESTFTIVKK
jgi:hypothetical protein